MPRRFPYSPGTKCARCPALLDVNIKSPYCRTCGAAYNRELRTRPDVKKKTVGRYRMVHYGVSEEAYEAMVVVQGNRCAACCEPETATRRGSVRSLSVDHDHETRKVRALLCSRCNTALGLLDEDPEKIQALRDYILAHQAERLPQNEVA